MFTFFFLDEIKSESEKAEKKKLSIFFPETFFEKLKKNSQ